MLQFLLAVGFNAGPLLLQRFLYGGLGGMLWGHLSVRTCLPSMCRCRRG
jgi:hypothetical protein